MNNIIEYDFNWVKEWIISLPIFKYLFINIESLPIDINKANSVYRQIIKIYHPDFNIDNLMFKEINNNYLKINISFDDLKKFKNDDLIDNKNGEFISFIKIFVVKYLTDKIFCDKIKSIDDSISLLSNNNLNNIQLDYKDDYKDYIKQYNNKELSTDEINNLYNKLFNTDKIIKDIPLNHTELNDKFNEINLNRTNYMNNINDQYKLEQNEMKDNKINFEDMFNNKLSKNNNLLMKDTINDSQSMTIMSFNDNNNLLDKYNLMSLNQDENISYKTQFDIKTNKSNTEIKSKTLEELIKERDEIFKK